MNNDNDYYEADIEQYEEDNEINAESNANDNDDDNKEDDPLESNHIEENFIYPGNQFNCEGFDTIELKGNNITSSIELNLNETKESKGNLIQKLCNKNSKYKEIIRMIDDSGMNNQQTSGNYNNNNNDETALNLINLFQQEKNKGLQAKMTKSKFCFLYNEINSMCSSSTKPLNYTNRIMTPTHYASQFNWNNQKPPSYNKYEPLLNKIKTLEIDTAIVPINLKRNQSLKNGLLSPYKTTMTMKEKIKQENGLFMQQKTIKNSSSFIIKEHNGFKNIQTVPSIMSLGKRKTFVASFSNDYYENELNKFSSRLSNKSKKNDDIVEMFMKKPNDFYNNVIMKKYDKMKGKNKSIFSNIK